MLGAVHTTGVNFESVGAIIGPLGGLLLTIIGGFYKLIKNRLDAQDLKKTAFELAVTNQHRELGHKVDEVKTEVSKVSERVARIEGPIRAPTN